MRRWALPLGLLIAGAAFIAALRVYNERTGQELDSRLWIPKPAVITPEVALLQQYVRIDTSNPPGRELAGARFLAGLLTREGVRAEVIETAPGRANVYARIAGIDHSQALLLLNHIDVVPAAKDGWTRPPFAADVYLNQLYGRGTLDMKGIAICELRAFLDVARTHRTPLRDIVFLATADEEAGSTFGMRWLLEHRPDIFTGVRYAINEGGITETTQERISYFGVEIGTKMTVKVRVRAPDRTTMQALRIALEPFITPLDPDRKASPEVQAFLRDLAPLRLEQGQYLSDISRTIDGGKFWLLTSGYREVLQNVVWPGAIETDPRGVTMRVNLYNLPDEDPNARIAWLAGIASQQGATIDAVLETSGPAPLSSRHTPLFALITNEAGRQYKGTRTGSEILALFYNDSRFLRTRGIDVYGLMPFPTDWYQTQGIHSTDERVRVDWFNSGATLVSRVVSRYAFESLPAQDK